MKRATSPANNSSKRARSTPGTSGNATRQENGEQVQRLVKKEFFSVIYNLKFHELANIDLRWFGQIILHSSVLRPTKKSLLLFWVRSLFSKSINGMVVRDAGEWWHLCSRRSLSETRFANVGFQTQVIPCWDQVVRQTIIDLLLLNHGDTELIIRWKISKRILKARRNSFGWNCAIM